MFADFALPHFESARRIHHAVAEWRRRTFRVVSRTQNQTVKDPTVPLWYTAKLDPRRLSDQDRLDPEPGRTPAPRMGPVRFLRKSKHNRLAQFVNQNLKDFCRLNHESTRMNTKGHAVAAVCDRRFQNDFLSARACANCDFLITYLTLSDGGRFP